LKPVLKEYFPQIKLAIDAEKRAAVEKLTMSGSFAKLNDTHTTPGMQAENQRQLTRPQL